MLNIHFTLSGGGGLVRDIWHMTESRRIHSQGLLLLSLLPVLLATGILNDLPGLTSCHCNNVELVLLILLGCELHVYTKPLSGCSLTYLYHRFCKLSHAACGKKTYIPASLYIRKLPVLPFIYKASVYK